MLPRAKRRKNLTTKLPIRGFVDLIYTGTVQRQILAKSGTMYYCLPDRIVKACDIDTQGLLSLGYFEGV